MSSESRELCMTYLKQVKDAKKSITGFPEMVTMLETEATNTGLKNDELELLASVITETTRLNSGQCVSLIQCLIPEGRISKAVVVKIGLWLVGSAKDSYTMPAVTAIRWLIGLMDYGLVEINVVNTFYDWFFEIMLKNKRLEPHISRLVYVLAKPDDVTRRQVSRLLNLQAEYKTPKKYLTAVLSLFKSYKPDKVPEAIPSINIESAWKSIPEALKQDLQKAAERCNRGLTANTLEMNFNWNPVKASAKSRANKQSLIPMVDYIQVGSSIATGRDTKSVFEIRTLEDLGKHQLSLELPCNSMSLLANEAGLHILTFASASYQTRFAYNLYNMLQNAFIYEIEKYSDAERDKLLTMTAKLTRYMGQEINLVSRFLLSYIPAWNTRDHRQSIFALIEWITFPCFAEVYDRILVPLRTMWECSLIEVKCEILRTLENMVTNLFIKAGLAETRPLSLKRPIFAGGSQSFDLVEVLEPLMEFIQDLIVIGLNIEANNSRLLSAALSFYEQAERLQERSDLPLWIITPPAVIYGGFSSRTMTNLSRICTLLLKYRAINAKLRAMNCRDVFKDKIETLRRCAKDLENGLGYDEMFIDLKDGYIIQFLNNNTLADLRKICALETALNISNHWAILPYKFTLIDMEVPIKTTEDYMEVAGIYYPEVAKFLQISTE